MSLMRDVFPERPFRVIQIDRAVPPAGDPSDRRSGSERRTVERASTGA
jgi:hypothetical protein